MSCRRCSTPGGKAPASATDACPAQAVLRQLCDVSRRGKYDKVPLADRLSGLTTQDIESASEENNIPLTKNVRLFTNTLLTSCRALGHTPEAAKMARRKLFVMLEYYGMNSLYLTVSQCDKCSLCFCLYTKLQKFVRWSVFYYNLQNVPTLTM